jgi:hypothetical protein
MRFAVGFFAQHSGYFATYHERVKFATSLGTWPDTTEQGVVFVMQGPVYKPDNFTIETIKMYRALHPGTPLVLSTWDDTPAQDLKALEGAGAELVLCQKPDDPGHSNINMQLTSARAGMMRAKELGAAWIIKTRTDQRMYASNLLSFLVATALSFPVASSSRQSHRIIGIGQGSLKYVPYHVTDQTLFGSADDMVQYWSAPLRPSSSYGAATNELAELYQSLSIEQLLHGVSAEPYISSEYLKRIGRQLDWTVEDSWRAYRDHFCFVDYASTDFYWAKGQQITLSEFLCRYDAVSNRQEIGFNDWLRLYSGRLPVELAQEHQKILKSPYNFLVERPGG